MRYEVIVAFLSGDLTPEALATEIANEVARHRAELRANSEAYLYPPVGPNFVVDRDGARRMLRALESGQLGFDAANYIADCLVAGEPFEFADEATREAIFFLEDDTARFVTGDSDWTPSSHDILQALAALD